MHGTCTRARCPARRRGAGAPRFCSCRRTRATWRCGCPSCACWRATWTARCWRSGALPSLSEGKITGLKSLIPVAHSWTVRCWRSGALPPAVCALLLALSAPAGALPGLRGKHGAQARVPSHVQEMLVFCFLALPGLHSAGAHAHMHSVICVCSALPPCARWRATGIAHADKCVHMTTHVQLIWQYGYPCTACCPTV